MVAVHTLDIRTGLHRGEMPRKGESMMFIRSILFQTFYFAGTFFWALGLTPLALAKSRDPMLKGVLMWSHIVIWAMRVIAGIKFEVRGSENLPKSGAYILAAKHMSNLDPMVAFDQMPTLTALAKKEIFAIPGMGAVMRKMGVIRVDRQSGTAHRGMTGVAEQIREAGRPLLIYPEGTRSKIHEHKRLKRGTYHLHKDGPLPVYTAASNAGLFWGKKSLLCRRGTLVFEIHEAIPDGLDPTEFMAILKERVIDRSDTLMREADIVGPNPFHEPEEADER